LQREPSQGDTVHKTKKSEKEREADERDLGCPKAFAYTQIIISPRRPCKPGGGPTTGCRCMERPRAAAPYVISVGRTGQLKVEILSAQHNKEGYQEVEPIKIPGTQTQTDYSEAVGPRAAPQRKKSEPGTAHAARKTRALNAYI